METRLAGIVITLWFFFGLLSLFIASVFSPMGMGLLLPDRHPLSWIYPALLLLPPITLGLHRVSTSTASRLLLFAVATALGISALALFAFLAATFVGH